MQFAFKFRCEYPSNKSGSWDIVRLEVDDRGRSCNWEKNERGVGAIIQTLQSSPNTKGKHNGQQERLLRGAHRRRLNC